MLNCNSLTPRQKKKSGVFSAPIESTYLIYQASKINTRSGGTVPLSGDKMAWKTNKEGLFYPVLIENCPDIYGMVPGDYFQISPRRIPYL